MGIEISHNTNTGHWRFSYKRHVLNALGVPLILSGFASFAAPWWMGIAVSVLEKMNIIVREDYQWILGLSQILLGTSLVIIKYFVLDRRVKEIQTDKETLNNSNIHFEIIRDHLSQLANDHSYKSSLDSKFYESYTYFNKPENSFQYNKSKKLYNAYVKASEALYVFTSQNFWVFPRNQKAVNDCRYCLSPHYNIDRDLLSGDPDKMNKYDEQSKRLIALVNNTESQLNCLISHLKCIGNV